MTIEKLREVNDMPIYSVEEADFIPFGRILTGYDFSEMIDYMEKNTEIPETGNIYVASVPEMEAMETAKVISDVFYGNMPCEIGYCNGKNSTYNGFEYHKGSEINVALSDLCLVLGHVWQIDEENKFYVGNEKVFFIKKGTAVELYQTTLHLSPSKVCEEGFKTIVVLPKGTNTPLENKPEVSDRESRLLLQKNKWVVAHPEREPLIKQGAFPGLIGENKEIKWR